MNNNQSDPAEASAQAHRPKLTRRATAALLARAEVALRDARPLDAERQCQTVLDDDPSHVGALEILAQALWRSSRMDGLVPVVKQLIVANPYEPGYHALLARALEGLGRCGLAIESHMRGGEALSAEALAEWQAELIAMLVADDRVFAAHYAQDSQAACSVRGYVSTSEGSTAESWYASQESFESYCRPS